MKIFLLSLLTFMVVIAASALDGRKPYILREIIHSIKVINESLTTEIFVQKVITTEHCTPKNFCRAGNILSAYEAQELGLKEKDWLLPRKLVAYTSNIYCKDPTSEDQVPLRHLLEAIHWCAQQEYSTQSLLHHLSLKKN